MSPFFFKVGFGILLAITGILLGYNEWSPEPHQKRNTRRITGAILLTIIGLLIAFLPTPTENSSPEPTTLYMWVGIFIMTVLLLFLAAIDAALSIKAINQSIDQHNQESFSTILENITENDSPSSSDDTKS